ncbi:MAG: prolyl oligopeptidase family serine peptidase [Planctomycetota bacterium]
MQQIRTPFLIMHGDQDLRTGVSQSEMFYKSLKILGRQVEYVRYPDEGHELSRSGDPKRRMDRLNRIIEFFERYRIRADVKSSPARKSQ